MFLFLLLVLLFVVVVVVGGGGGGVAAAHPSLVFVWVVLALFLLDFVLFVLRYPQNAIFPEISEVFSCFSPKTPFFKILFFHFWGGGWGFLPLVLIYYYYNYYYYF